jgi:hypothetical protein
MRQRASLTAAASTADRLEVPFEHVGDIGVASSEAGHFRCLDIEQRRRHAIEVEALQPVIDDDVGDGDDFRLGVFDPEFGAAERKIGGRPEQLEAGIWLSRVNDF